MTHSFPSARSSDVKQVVYAPNRGGPVARPRRGRLPGGAGVRPGRPRPLPQGPVPPVQRRLRPRAPRPAATDGAPRGPGAVARPGPVGAPAPRVCAGPLFATGSMLSGSPYGDLSAADLPVDRKSVV